MAKYLIADFIVDIQNRYAYLERQCAGYLYNGNAPATITVCVSEQAIAQEKRTSAVEYSPGYLESVCAYRELCGQLPYSEALLLHASVISFRGQGIAFVARSGVGKTTHTMLWKDAFAEQVRVVNGDKPIIRFKEAVPYAYGTPWAGKENLQCNECVRLTDICFLERSDINATDRLPPEACLDAMMLQVLHSEEPMAEVKVLGLIDQLLSACKLWRIRCNISPEAVNTAFGRMIGDDPDEIKV